jgi:DnaJ-class molecular chaperone
MYGIKPLMVRPGTKPGSQLTIRNAGVMKAGDHIVEVSAIFPTETDLRGGPWKGLDINWDDPDEEDDGDAELMRIFESVSVESIFRKVSTGG